MFRLLISLCIFGIFAVASQPSYAETANDGIKSEQMIVRIARIEVHPEFLEEYLRFVNENALESLTKEPGVISLFAMQDPKNITMFSILEIYRSSEDYQNHLKSNHFLKYKKGTLHMVKDLQLIDMTPVNSDSIAEIFKKAELNRTVSVK